ncbi:MAG: CopD family protein [Acetobacteraceae bacterium]
MSPDPLLAILRGAHVAALISAFGTLVFVVLSASGGQPRLTKTLRRLARGSLALALALGVAWFVLVARAMAGAASLAETFAALGLVAGETQFGGWLLARLGLLIAASLLCSRMPRLAALPTGAALALQPELAHAGAIGGWVGAWLTGSEAVHVLAAGAWLGGLMPLAIAIAVLPPATAAALCRRFSALALAAVIILAGSAAVQGSLLFGGWSGLLTTTYGHVALAKLALFACTVLLGALNRFRLVRRIGTEPRARQQMSVALATETGLGLAIVLAAAWLASLAPGIDAHPAAPAALIPILAAAGTVAALCIAACAGHVGRHPRFSGLRFDRGTMT